VTARQEKLITKLYQVERSQTVVARGGPGPASASARRPAHRLDHAVNAALISRKLAFYSGDRVALLAYDRKVA